MPYHVMRAAQRTRTRQHYLLPLTPMHDYTAWLPTVSTAQLGAPVSAAPPLPALTAATSMQAELGEVEQQFRAYPLTTTAHLFETPLAAFHPRHQARAPKPEPRRANQGLQSCSE